MIFPDFHKVQVMAVVNVTADSFYSVSRTDSVEALERRILEAVEQGATIIDIGGYSSRPGADDIPLEEEWRRVDLGVGVVRRTGAKYGKILVNDITAAEADEQMIPTIAQIDLPYIAMHMRGTPQTMQTKTEYDDVVTEVADYLMAKTAQLEAAGVPKENIILDPGFGFAKSVEQNYALLAGLSKIVAMGYPVLAGLSRKSMIYKVLSSTAEEVLPGTIALNWEALRQGATILRVHDVAEAVQIAKIYDTSFRGL